MTADPSRGYVPHIDGLRAIAVLAVIVFHLDPAWLPGGDERSNPGGGIGSGRLSRRGPRAGGTYIY